MLIIDMPKLISVDKKLNVIESYENKKEHNLTTSKVCDIFKVSRKSIYNWRKKVSKNLPLKIKKWNKISIVTPEIEQFIINKTINNPKFNANKLAKKVNKQFNIKIKRNKIYRILKKNNITHKKAYTVVIKNEKKHIGDVKTKKEEVLKVKNKIIFMDESSIDINIRPTYGWNKKNKRTTFIRNNIPKRKRYSMIIYITNKTKLGYKLVDKTVNAQMFTDITDDIVMKRKKNKILFMDNARIHHAKLFKEKLKTSTISSIYNIPYTPQLNPSEGCFNQIKIYLKNHYELASKNIHKAVQQAWNHITNQNIKNYFYNSYLRS